jgi:hypothetical protein
MSLLASENENNNNINLDTLILFDCMHEIYISLYIWGPSWS